MGLRKRFKVLWRVVTLCAGAEPEHAPAEAGPVESGEPGPQPAAPARTPHGAPVVVETSIYQRQDSAILRAHAAHVSEVPPEQRLAQAVAHSEHVKVLSCSADLPAGLQGVALTLRSFRTLDALYEADSSVVFKASVVDSGAEFALKVYFTSSLGALAKRALEREISIHSQMHHKNILRLYAAFEEGSVIVLVLELAERGDVRSLLRCCGGRLGDADAARLLRGAVAALAYAHAHDVIHRDVKPDNFLLSANGEVKLADFGVAVDVGQDMAVTCTGTLGYQAPEVATPSAYITATSNAWSGQGPDRARTGPYSASADVWSLGAVAYQVLCGILPSQALAMRSSIDIPAGVMVIGSAASPASTLSGSHANHSADSCGATVAPERLEFPQCVSAAARSFVQQALAPQPAARPSATELLQHPWLTQQRVGQAAPASTDELKTFDGDASTCLVTVSDHRWSPVSSATRVSAPYAFANASVVSSAGWSVFGGGGRRSCGSFGGTACEAHAFVLPPDTSKASGDSNDSAAPVFDLQ